MPRARQILDVPVGQVGLQCGNDLILERSETPRFSQQRFRRLITALCQEVPYRLGPERQFPVVHPRYQAGPVDGSSAETQVNARKKIGTRFVHEVAYLVMVGGPRPVAGQVRHVRRKRQPACFEHQRFDAGVGQAVGQAATPHAGTDDDDVVEDVFARVAGNAVLSELGAVDLKIVVPVQEAVLGGREVDRTLVE